MKKLSPRSERSGYVLVLVYLSGPSAGKVSELNHFHSWVNAKNAARNRLDVADPGPVVTVGVMEAKEYDNLQDVEAE